MNKTRIAFIKFGGLAVGGSELWLQKLAVNLPKDKYEVDYYYSDTAPSIGTDYKPNDTDPDRLKYMIDNKINLIKFKVGAVDHRFHYHPWKNTDFWKLFDAKRYDLVQTVKAGQKEYPFYLIDLPIVEIVALANRPDKSRNIAWSFHFSDWQRKVWIRKGGDRSRSSALFAPLEQPLSNENLRKELNIPKEAIVAGFHQRADDNIWSKIPLNAFKKCWMENRYFIILGGSELYRKQARELGLKNVFFIQATGNRELISKFLNTIDIFAHGRKDGETFGCVFAEAIIHGKPCLSHHSETGLDAQKETMGPAGLFAMDEKEYTEKLALLFNDENLRNRLANEAKNMKHIFSIENTVKETIKVYEEVLSDPDRFKIKINHFTKTKDQISQYFVFVIKQILNALNLKDIVYNYRNNVKHNI